ncbi:MAG: response regulator [Chloroflexota bacterium]
MPQTILIAATDANIVYLLQRYAEASGFHVVSCGHEERLIGLAREFEPSLIVLEVEPPETAWRQCLKRLQEDAAVSKIPVVAYSCYDDIACGQDSRFAGFLQKSVMYDDFVLALEKIGVHPVDLTE